MKFSYKYQVEPQDVDFTGRATLTALESAVLNTANLDAKRQGFGLGELGNNTYSWVLSRMALDFDYMPAQDTEYSITTWVNECGRALTTRNFTLSDGRGDEFGRSVTQWCLFDLESRTPVDLTQLSERIELADIPSPMEKPRRVRSVEPTTVEERKVRYSDIDFNRHVSTLQYARMMLDVLPIEMLNREYGMRFDIFFMHECLFEDTLTVGYEQRDGIILFEIKSGDGTIATRASLEFKLTTVKL